MKTTCVRRRTARASAFAAVLATACAAPPDDAMTSDTLIALPATDHLGGLAREPMIVETADGTLFVTGYGEERPMLWRSSDGGATWDSVHVGTEAAGATGNSDVDLAVAPDGTLHFIVMSFDRTAFEGTGITVASSTDDGATWRWTPLSRDRFDDRPWIEVAPDGTAHAIWNDGAGVAHAVSTDGGAGWTERPRIHALGGSSHMAIAPDGALAVRVTPLSASANRHDPDVDHIAVSTDGGASWTAHTPPDTPPWTQSLDPAEAVVRWVEPVAWDAAGTLWLLTSTGTELVLVQSMDRGATWTRWPIVQGAEPLYFPYLVAREPGELAATWFSGAGDALRVNVAHVRADPAGTQPPHVTRAKPFAIDAFLRGADSTAAPVRDPAGEYVPVLFLRDGRIATVTPIQDPAGDRWGFTFRPFRMGR